jgi:Na+/H+-dicarboxylate symporter
MSETTQSGGGMSLTTKIMLGMAGGLITGTILNMLGSASLNGWLVDGLFSMVGAAFVNGLKMLVVPLVVFSLICGVLGIGDIRVLGRVGGKSFVLYIATTAIAIATAIVLGILIGPGKGFVMEGVDTSASPPPMRRPSGRSSPISCPRTRSRRWPAATCCRSSFTSSWSASPR